MRLLRGCLILAFLLGAYIPIYAQDASGIHGKVYGEKRQPADAATVILLAATDSSIVKSTTCDNNGEYRLAVKPGRYLLLISRLRYDQSLTGPYIVKPGADLLVNDVRLILHTPLLKEVNISAQRQYLEVRPDRVTLNVGSSISSDANSIFEILRQAPGVHADTKGSISLIGRANALVMMNGKPIYLTGPDLVDYLRSIPANTVKQVELITSPPAKYDAAGAGVINIISKKGAAVGTNFTVSSNAGYGQYGKAGAGIIFNSQYEKVNVFGNYNYSYDKTNHIYLTDRKIDFQGLKSEYNLDYRTVYQGPKQAFTIGADFTLSKKHTIGVSFSGNIVDNNYTKDNHLRMNDAGVLDSIISAKSNLKRGLYNYDYDVNYTGKLDTAGKVLSADVVFSDIDRRSSEYIDNFFYNLAWVPYRPDLKLRNLSPANAYIWSAKVDYVNPLSKTSRIETGLKYSLVRTDNQLIFGPQVNGVYQSSPNLSSSFRYSENVNSGYLDYYGKAGKFDIRAGLRLEQTNTRGNGSTNVATSDVAKHYLDWFPGFELNYSIDKKQSLNLSFNRGIDRPSFRTVNPFLYYADLYDNYKGNPNILPQYTNRVVLSHVYNSVITSLYATITTNFYGFINYQQNDTTKTSQSLNSNFGKYSIYGVRIFVPVTYTSWWDADFGLDASYQRMEAYPRYGTLNKGTQLVSFTSTQRLKLTQTFLAEVAWDYESPAFYGIGQFKADYWVRAGLAKKVLNNNGRISFDVSDIFNTHRDLQNINYQNLNMTVYDKKETRVFKLSFTYRFGNVSLKTITRHKVSNEEEQSRATGD